MDLVIKISSWIDKCLFSRVIAHLRFTQILLGGISGVALNLRIENGFGRDPLG